MSSFTADELNALLREMGHEVACDREEEPSVVHKDSFTTDSLTFRHYRELQNSDQVLVSAGRLQGHFYNHNFVLKRYHARCSPVMERAKREFHALFYLELRRRRARESQRARAAFLVRMHRCRQPAINRVHFLLTWALGGDLWSQQYRRPDKRFSEREARFYLAELTLGLEFLHLYCKVVHRDIKLENVFLDAQGHVLLGDFDCAALVNLKPQAVGRIGTSHAMAPEVSKGLPHDQSADIFSLGMLALGMVLGKCRPEAKTELENREMERRGDYVDPRPFTSPVYADFVEQLVRFRPDSRPPTQRLRRMALFQANDGEWEEVDWEKLTNRQVAPPALHFGPDEEAAVVGAAELEYDDTHFKGEWIPDSAYDSELFCEMMGRDDPFQQLQPPPEL